MLFLKELAYITYMSCLVWERGFVVAQLEVQRLASGAYREASLILLASGGLIGLNDDRVNEPLRETNNPPSRDS